jgi:hypothetical protein
MQGSSECAPRAHGFFFSGSFAPQGRSICNHLFQWVVNGDLSAMGSVRFLLALAVAGGHAASMFGFGALWILPGGRAVQISGTGTRENESRVLRRSARARLASATRPQCPGSETDHSADQCSASGTPPPLIPGPIAVP